MKPRRISRAWSTAPPRASSSPRRASLWSRLCRLTRRLPASQGDLTSSQDKSRYRTISTPCPPTRSKRFSTATSEPIGEGGGMAYTIRRGGRVLDIAKGTAEFADILIEDDTIRELGPPGSPAPDGAREIAAARRLIHPGLVNAHTHAHGNLAKGMGDRWTLELLLTAAPWITGNRTQDDIQLTAQLGAVEMVLK